MTDGPFSAARATTSIDKAVSTSGTITRDSYNWRPSWSTNESQFKTAKFNHAPAILATKNGQYRSCAFRCRLANCTDLCDPSHVPKSTTMTKKKPLKQQTSRYKQRTRFDTTPLNTTAIFTAGNNTTCRTPLPSGASKTDQVAPQSCVTNGNVSRTALIVPLLRNIRPLAIAIPGRCSLERGRCTLCAE